MSINQETHSKGENSHTDQRTIYARLYSSTASCIIQRHRLRGEETPPKLNPPTATRQMISSGSTLSVSLPWLYTSPFPELDYRGRCYRSNQALGVLIKGEREIELFFVCTHQNPWLMRLDCPCAVYL